MNELDRALRRAGRAGYEQEAEAAAARMVDQAADAGLIDVAYTTLETPVGPVMVAATRRGLVRIAFGSSLDRERFLADLGTRISPRLLEAPSYFDGVRRELDEYFHGQRTEFDLPLDWSLTRGFGRRVLKRTARIPYGEVSTYREMATAAGSPAAVRAAGNALGSNPLPLIVPCHRVLRTGGALGGYGGGIEVKELLLRLEGAR